MKYIIDDIICEKHDISIEELLLGLACKESNGLNSTIKSMIDKGYLKVVDREDEEPLLYPTKDFDDRMCSILLRSDKTVPDTDRCESLAVQMRAIFPKGIKTGSSAWRGNLRDISLRLKKFFKLYGNTWSDEEILDATKRYVDHFNGVYTYMRILKYFIMKSARVQDEEGNNHIEDISELATWLENADQEEYKEDWTSSLV